MSVYLLL